MREAYYHITLYGFFFFLHEFDIIQRLNFFINCLTNLVMLINGNCFQVEDVTV